MIPTEFSILGIKYKIEYARELADKLGVCDYNKAKITLLDDNLSSDLMEQTFWHEVVHVILDSIGEKELSDNEILVNKFSGALHQIIKTSIY